MFDRLRAGHSTPEDVLADLVDFHAAHPGITEATLGPCRTGSGHTGYDVLVDQLRPEDRAVADLGCGNGPLLERLAALPRLERLVGVDACAAELARVRVKDPRLTLGEALPDGLDAVLSHHAFYLMRPPEPVVEALARALRPGGLFAWITTSGRTGQHPLYVELFTALAPLVAEAVPAFPGWGDRRQWTPAGRQSLFPAVDWEPLEEKDFVLLVREPPEVLFERLAGFHYTAWLVDRARLREAWMPLLRPGPDGLVDFEWPWACVIARRRAVLPAR